MVLTLDAIEYPPGSDTYQSIGSSTDYGGRFTAAQPYGGTSAQINAQPVPNTNSLLNSISGGGRRIPVMLVRERGGAVDAETFHENVMKWFAPVAKSTSGKTTRYLRVLHHDGSTQLRIPVNVVACNPRGGVDDVFDVTLESLVPYFEDITSGEQTNTTSAGAATVANAGNHRAPVTLELTGSAITGVRYTVTDAGGDGLADYIIQLNSEGGGATSSQTFVLVNGKNVPHVSGQLDGSLDRWFWCRIDVEPGGSVTVDIIPSTGVTNPLADTLDVGSLSNASSGVSDYQWIVDIVSIINSPAQKQGIWSPRRFLLNNTAPEGFGYAISQTGSSGTFDTILTLNNPRQGAANDANAIGLMGGVPAGSSNDLTNVERVTASHTAGVRSFCRFRIAGSRTWETAWSQTADGTVTTSIDVDEAVEIVIGIEYTDSGSPTDGATLTLDESSGNAWDLDLNTFTNPSTSSAAKSWALLDGAVTNSTTGQVVTFSDYIYPSGELVIDFDRVFEHGGITLLAVGATLGSITFSDPAEGMSLEPGNNSITETVNGDVDVKHFKTYA